jgi:hypothetical protein
MGYTWGKAGGKVKEVKIRLSKDDHKRLREAARKNLRSMNKQVTVFVVAGLEQEKQEARNR